MTSSSSLTHHTPSKIPYTEATRQRVSEIKARLEKCEHLWLPLQETLDLLEALTQFELGRFLLLDYSDLKDIQLTGIDIDAESLNLARENAHRMGVQADVQFLKQDAWQL